MPVAGAFILTVHGSKAAIPQLQKTHQNLALIFTLGEKVRVHNS